MNIFQNKLNEMHAHKDTKVPSLCKRSLHDSQIIPQVSLVQLQNSLFTMVPLSQLELFNSKQIFHTCVQHHNKGMKSRISNFILQKLLNFLQKKIY